MIRMRQQPAPSVWQFLVQGMGDGHRFGDLTLLELHRGEIWRSSHAPLFIIASFTSRSTCWHFTC